MSETIVGLPEVIGYKLVTAQKDEATANEIHGDDTGYLLRSGKLGTGCDGFCEAGTDEEYSPNQPEWPGTVYEDAHSESEHRAEQVDCAHDVTLKRGEPSRKPADGIEEHERQKKRPRSSW
ncbi:hypothetical protein ACLI4Z_02970 [Natrialbaceae archaeon A-arb3/5]